MQFTGRKQLIDRGVAFHMYAEKHCFHNTTTFLATKSARNYIYGANLQQQIHFIGNKLLPRMYFLSTY